MATATGENIEGAAFYSYLFAKAKPIPAPTPTLDALLRALALHIKTEIDDKKEPHLTPAKLATFYKNAGYNFDSLFVDMPHLFISDVFQGLGCRHWLLPTDNDYAAPSIPALTIEGFVRWQAIQILLEPSTQVPIMQFAVRNWCLKHPDTGILFPPDLPAEAFPMNSDLDTEAWYQECKNKHIRAAEEEKPKERPTEKPAEESRPFGDRKAPSFTRIHVQPSPRDYFESRPSGRNVKVTYVNMAPGPSARSPEQDRERAREHERAHREAYLRRQPSSPNEPSRRRSFSDYPHSPNDTRPAAVRVSPHLAPERGPQQQRRHSQPRHYSTSESDTPVSPRTTRRSPHRPPSDAPIPGVRRVYTGSSEDIPRIIRTSMPPPPIPTAHSQPIGRTHSPRPSTPRDDDGKRRGALYEIRDKISNFVNGTSERQRSLSGGRGGKDGPVSSSARGSRDENHPSSRLSRSWSNDETDDTDSEDERIRRSRKHSRESREREQRERERAAAHERERERERDRARDRERDRHRDRHSDRDRDSDERRHSDRDRERERRGRDRPPSAPRAPRSHVSDTEDDNITPRERFSRGSGGSNGPYLSRPDVHRRTSSHADIDRRRDLGREIRDRDYFRDQRDRDRAGRDRERWRREERLSPRDHGGDRSRERDRERKNDGEARRERMASPSAAATAAAASLGPGGVTSGVGGRKYPDLGSWQGRD